MKIAIGNDHVAVELKNIIKEHLEGKGHEVINYGTDSTERFDYPISGYRVGKAVASGECDLGADLRYGRRHFACRQQRSGRACRGVLGAV